MLKKFIQRPVLSAVISIFIVILGIIGLRSLPMEQYPDIAPPTVRITANFPGASASTLIRSVIAPIEEQVNGVEGMTYISSTATNDGSATINVFFDLETDPDMAAVNVQNRVNRAMPLLPEEVVRSGVVTQKQLNSALMFVQFYSEKFDLTYLKNYIEINIAPELKRIKGVADVTVPGNRTYAMRIWLLPEKLAAYGLEPQDVINKINAQSLEVAAGRVGSNADRVNEYIIRYKGRFDNETDYENIILKASGNGHFLRLKDVAKVQLDAQTYDNIREYKGQTAQSLGVYINPGANSSQVNKEVLDYLQSVEHTFPEGLNWGKDYDYNTFLLAALDQIEATLLEAFILVFVVVLVFLQDWRSTLIPAIAVPISIVGSFFFLNLFGFSINILTLFALVLAIGIVVDDAIVVVENVHSQLEKKVQSAREATVTAMGEISGAIVSITLVLGAVFIPVTFISGTTGAFYKQFGITLMVTIFISAVNALTLTPMLCALFLKPKNEDRSYQKKNFVEKFNHKFNLAFQSGTKRYAVVVKNLIKRKWIVAVMFVGAIGLLFWSSQTMPTGFVPTEDRDVVFINIELPPGASLERTGAVCKELERKVLEANLPNFDWYNFEAGANIFSGAGSNYASAYVHILPFKERTDKHFGINEYIARLNEIAQTIVDAEIILFAPSSVPGYAHSSGVSVVLLDKAGNEIERVNEIAQLYIAELMKRPEIKFAQTPFNIAYPQYELEVNTDRVAEAGMEVSQVLFALQGYVGNVYAADFTKFGKPYRVMVQALPETRMDESVLKSFYVKTGFGKMAPISQFLSLKRVYGPQMINRFNLYTSVNISGESADGYSTGDAIRAFEEVAEQHLPLDFGIEFSGLTREEIATGNQTLFIFLLCVLFIYFLLSAQYESFIQPLSVILSLPFGIMGAFVGQHLAGLENNIFFQISLIMLVGLLAKNAILIVEFALQRRKSGESIAQSAINAAKARLRPILMTSFAFIFGIIPLVIASGTGAIGNRSVGTGAASGLLIGTVFGVLVVPVLFVILRWMEERVRLVKGKY